MRKLKPGEKRVVLNVHRPEDVSLFERLETMAFERRYDLSTFILLSLQDAFADTGAASPPESPQ